MKTVFLKQHSLWLPKWWLVFSILVLMLILTSIFIRYLGYYLAETNPEYGPYLVVEGWQDEHSLKQALTVFQDNNYQYLMTTGGPNTRQVNPEYSSYAQQSAGFFIGNGLDSSKIIVIATPASAQDRTFLSAVMVRKWFEKQNITVTTIDVFSQGVHARRSRQLYEMAFQPSIKIGIYASISESYSLSKWWQTSDGAKSVIEEVIGIIWTACFFDAGKYGSHQEMWGEAVINTP